MCLIKKLDITYKEQLEQLDLLSGNCICEELLNDSNFEVYGITKNDNIIGYFSILTGENVPSNGYWTSDCIALDNIYIEEEYYTADNFASMMNYMKDKYKTNIFIIVQNNKLYELAKEYGFIDVCEDIVAYITTP